MGDVFSSTKPPILRSKPELRYTSNMDLTLDNALATWDVLTKRLEAFMAAWDRGETPEIAAFLPASGGSLRRLVLIELIKADLDYRFGRGQGRLLEAYMADFPDLASPAGPPADLVYEEYHVRRSKGESVQQQDYLTRFPGRKSELERLWGAVDVSQSTAIIADRPQADLRVGDTIDDFDLLARVGEGAFGNVFLARQRSISRLVALKVSADRGQEARMLAQLDHPNIVRVYDQRRLPERQLRLVYMQFASGGTLADLAASSRELMPQDRHGGILVQVLEASSERCGLGPMADPHTLRSLSQLTWPEIVCRLGAQLAQALDYAHRHGVLHRDVKPANILLAGDGTPKLADFNISSLSSHPNLGASAYFGGSLAYMSPEHLEAFNPQHKRDAEELDGRTDLYSLAVVLWELLCGQKPFRDSKVGDEFGETLAAMTERRRRCEFENATIPSGETAKHVLDVLKRALSPNPDDRPANGADFAQDLLLCVQPNTQRLLRFSGRGWREWVRRFPVIAVLIVVTLPNALAGIFNYIYNESAIIEQLKTVSSDVAQEQSAKDAFFRVQMVINSVAFPVGAILVWMFVWPVARRLKRQSTLSELTPEGQAALRRYALRLGHLAAVIGIIEWLIAGMIYPAAIHALNGYMPAEAYPHFWISLALCGLVAAAYPFFGVTLLAVRVFFPALLARGAVDEAAEAQLRRLSAQAGMYFLIACGVPLIGLSLLILRGSDQRAALVTLAFMSLGGLAVAFKTYSMILRDIAALMQVVKPVDPFGMESSTRG